MEDESPNLPYEIIFNILSRLSVKVLCRFKSVSKPWLSLITNPHFAKAHLNQSTKDENTSTQKLLLASRSFSLHLLLGPQSAQTLAQLEMPCKSSSPAEIFGSYNGIVLLRFGAELCLWNPTIRTYKTFSQPEYPDGNAIVIYGLGYNSVIDDIMVVRAIRPLVDAPSAVHVFSSNLGSWKRIEDFGYEIFQDGPGATLNGAPHWVVGRGSDSSISEVVVWFDAFEEKFKEVPLPTNDGRDKIIELRILGGWLCVAQKDPQYESLARVWMMKEYGVKESWTKPLCVPYGL